MEMYSSSKVALGKNYGSFEIETPIITQKEEKKLKGDTFKTFSKLYSKPSNVDKTSTVHIETRKELKKRTDQIIFSYDIDAPQETQSEIEHKMVKFCSINHPNILKHDTVYVKNPIQTTSYTYFISTSQSSLKKNLETEIYETLQASKIIPPKVGFIFFLTLKELGKLVFSDFVRFEGTS
jgi:hypothetical protein